MMGGMHYLFHNDADQEDVNTGIMIYDPNVKGGDRDRIMERMDWLGYAGRFFNGTFQDLDSMKPPAVSPIRVWNTRSIAGVVSRSGLTFRTFPIGS